MQKLNFKTPVTNSFFWGLSGGIFFLGLRFLPVVTAVSEIAMLLVYCLFFIFSFFTFRPESKDKLFFKTFLSSILTFLLIPIFAHVGLVLILHETQHLPQLFGPFFIMTGVGIVICLLLTTLMLRRRKAAI